MRPAAESTLEGEEPGERHASRPPAGCHTNVGPASDDLQGGGECVRVGTRSRQLAECYSGTVGTGASGWDARAERSIAMAAYPMTPVTTQRISVR